jgi:hypothetical protein
LLDSSGEPTGIALLTRQSPFSSTYWYRGSLVPDRRSTSTLPSNSIDKAISLEESGDVGSIHP